MILKTAVEQQRHEVSKDTSGRYDRIGGDHDSPEEPEQIKVRFPVNVFSSAPLRLRCFQSTAVYRLRGSMCP